MDKRGGGQVTFKDFARACFQTGFRGPVREAFDQLAGGAETFGPEALDRRLPEDLAPRGEGNRVNGQSPQTKETAN